VTAGFANRCHCDGRAGEAHSIALFYQSLAVRHFYGKHVMASREEREIQPNAMRLAVVKVHARAEAHTQKSGSTFQVLPRSHVTYKRKALTCNMKVLAPIIAATGSSQYAGDVTARSFNYRDAMLGEASASHDPSVHF
jgi:hypothetical protein